MIENSEKKVKCQDVANLFDLRFAEIYKHCYNLLEHGEKKYLHLSVIELTSPNIAQGTARTYCTKLDKIPEKSRAWYYKNIAANLVFELEKKADSIREAADVLSTKLIIELKNIEDENL